MLIEIKKILRANKISVAELKERSASSRAIVEAFPLSYKRWLDLYKGRAIYSDAEKKSMATFVKKFSHTTRPQRSNNLFERIAKVWSLYDVKRAEWLDKPQRSVVADFPSNYQSYRDWLNSKSSPSKQTITKLEAYVAKYEATLHASQAISILTEIEFSYTREQFDALRPYIQRLLIKFRRRTS